MPSNRRVEKGFVLARWARGTSCTQAAGAKRKGVPCTRRRASVSIEVLILLPIVVAVSVAVIEFGMYVGWQQRFAAATRDAVRVAAVGGTEDEVRDILRAHLSDGILNQATVTILIEDGGVPRPTGSPVLVRVEINAAILVPDLLRFVGFTIRTESIAGQAVMRKE